MFFCVFFFLSHEFLRFLCFLQAVLVFFFAGGVGFLFQGVCLFFQNFLFRFFLKRKLFFIFFNRICFFMFFFFSNDVFS